ncbi:hypothetical protein L484_017528 [Morus notabilis]|uniref:non-specific serine/threonine protein kinase n=1 Tax=Morus notabilis TaxID=981085 RepID=W9R455_9ROSA|nr:hypothetical protein L484_017528 [Morus notabilis]
MMIKMFFSQSPFLFLVTFFYVILSSNASAQLPKSEVEALREIAKTLGKTNWNFSVDPCSGDYGWVTKNPVQGFENAVSCNRSFCSATACHVTSIVLKAQSLPGTLPKDLLKLPYLQEFDLSRNYLNGTIPPEWGSSQLVNISLLGNRLTGSIPKELANITTLKSLVLEINRLSGNLPPELGNLSNIERFLVTSNNFTGELPETLGKLTTLKDLRISDLSGSEATFPPLNNMTKMKTLILRNCNLNGTIPDYLGEMSSLKTLDLSFNKLSGNVPNSLASLSNVDYIFLTGNLLSGEVAEWLLTKGESIDLSYNNFTVNNSSCQQRNVNLFASSSQGNNSKIVSCLTCYGNWYSLHINCGGKEVTVNGTTFESDTDSAGPSNLFVSKTNWAVSTTGYFADNDSPKDSYTTGNLSSLTVANPELYMNARLSPISLTYYAFCLGNGNYTVKLHFAEIMFTNDTTYSSLGRRLFDVYIQGKLVLKDFNIADEAGQAGKAVIKNFTAVVTSSTLDIRFYWAGKGTTAIPNRGVYGPLISAISVNSDFQPPSTSTETGSSISVGAIVGIVVGSLLVVLLIIGVLWRKCCQRRKTTLEQDLKGVDLKTGKFTLRQIKAATNNFDVANKIGEGGFGPVYKDISSSPGDVRLNDLPFLGLVPQEIDGCHNHPSRGPNVLVGHISGRVESLIPYVITCTPTWYNIVRLTSPGDEDRSWFIRNDTTYQWFESFWGETQKQNRAGSGPKRTISYQVGVWVVTYGIRDSTQPEMWPTRTLGPHKEG